MTVQATSSYRGRFAPSPTGPLHFGSLVAALASYLDARANHGTWLVRMEDLDPPRNSTEAASSILRALEHFGLEWDGPVLYQSTRIEQYEDALDQLIASDLIYPCTCPRTSGGAVYDGTCRARSIAELPARPHALRLRVSAAPILFQDLVRGPQRSRLDLDAGDFVVKRKEGYFAYQLAVVVDDAFQGITRVVRGNDLLDSTCRQIYLQRCLGYPEPEYAHTPLIVDAHGDKLSKQTFASPLALQAPGHYLFAALSALGITPPEGSEQAQASELLAWAATVWNLAQITTAPTLLESSLPWLASP